MSTQSDGTIVPKSLDSPHLSRDQLVGLEAERWTFDKLVKLGYSPEMSPDFLQEACDMTVKGLCVEVKVARLTYRKIKLSKTSKYYPRWQWHIHPTHKGEFALILIADCPKSGRYVFVVPGSQVGSTQHLQLTSHPTKYAGWLAKYRDKWEVIDYLAKQVYHDNGPLFEEWDQRERVAA